MSTDTQGSRIKSLSVGGVLAKVCVFLLLVIVTYPIVWILLSSIKAPAEFSGRPMYALPEGIYWQNYVHAWTVGRMGIYFRNSVLVVLPSLLLIIFLGAAAAFAIEKMSWKWKNGVMLSFLAGIMVPMQIVLLPLFFIYFRTGLLNNPLGLILAYTAFGLPMTVALFTTYFKAVPNEVIESGLMDGASIYQVFFRIAMPMVRNSIVTISLVQFFFFWNDLLLSLTFISSANLRTIQPGLLNFTGRFGQQDWGPTFAAISLTIIPTLILYMFLNKLVMKGMTSGAVKG